MDITVHTHTHIYIYIYREREREREIHSNWVTDLPTNVLEPPEGARPLVGTVLISQTCHLLNFSRYQ